jgi:hypothetical protein
LNTVVEKALGPNGKDPAVLADLQGYATVTQASERFRGIPFPGTFMLDRGGRVTARFFENYYWERNTVSNIMLKVGAAPTSVPALQASSEHLALKQRALNLGIDFPAARCLPVGPTIRALLGMVKILQTSGQLVMLYENQMSDRQVFLDGRELPQDPYPTWMGYSVGRWDGDTLVVESAGFNDKTWLDVAGHPHTERLRLQERFRRVDFGHMHVDLTIDDPGAYARPWVVPIDMVLNPDTELLESICNENERDTRAATTTRGTAPRVNRERPAKYAGTYQAAPGDEFVVTLEGDALMMRAPRRRAKIPLIPISETSFVQPDWSGSRSRAIDRFSWEEGRVLDSFDRGFAHSSASTGKDC